MLFLTRSLDTQAGTLCVLQSALCCHGIVKDLPSWSSSYEVLSGLHQASIFISHRRPCSCCCWEHESSMFVISARQPLPSPRRASAIAGMPHLWTVEVYAGQKWSICTKPNSPRRLSMDQDKLVAAQTPRWPSSGISPKPIDIYAGKMCSIYNKSSSPPPPDSMDQEFKIGWLQVKHHDSPPWRSRIRWPKVPLVIPPPPLFVTVKLHALANWTKSPNWWKGLANPHIHFTTHPTSLVSLLEKTSSIRASSHLQTSFQKTRVFGVCICKPHLVVFFLFANTTILYYLGVVKFQHINQ
jgi:hypothetical protein